MEVLDLLYVFKWWLMIFLNGIVFFPLTKTILKNFFDRGYIFSKVIGIIMTSYLIYVLGSLKLLSFTINNIIFILIVSLLVNYLPFVYLKTKKKLSFDKNLLSNIKTILLICLLEELIFIVAFFSWSYIKIHQPDINGLEKFMDFGIINSILRTDYFPAKDTWFTPLAINYYYFGHLTTAFLTKLSNTSSNISFNLMQALVFALCFTGSFSIGANLVFLIKDKTSKLLRWLKIFSAGLITAFLVTMSGNLHIIYGFFSPYKNESPIPPWELIFQPLMFPNAYWYPNATRFIHNTIHEFPMYSWVVSDLHGHVLDIPFVLLNIAFSLHLLIDKKINFFKIILFAFFISISYMTNAWDGVIYLMLAMATIICVNLKSFSGKKFILKTLSYCFTLFFSYFVFSLPFNLFFKPFVSGIGLICSPDFLIKLQKLGPFIFETDHCLRSPIYQLFILHGFFYFFVACFILFIVKIINKNKTQINKADFFVIILIIVSTLLILIPEFVYIKDIYPAHYRANTMFKLTYQSFIMLSISSSYIAIRILNDRRNIIQRFKGKLFFAIFTIVSFSFISLVLVYPFLSIASYYGDLKVKKNLDGTLYLKELYPNDYKAIDWINKNIKKQPVILEAQGDSYTDFARVSANTGLPTVLGWTVHEWLWRGSYNIPSPRIEDVQLLYETSDLAKTKNLLKKYNVSFVFVGKLEIDKYKYLNDDKFNNLGKIIYQSGETKIYKINSIFL